MPFLGVVLFFSKTSKYYAPEYIEGRLIQLFILTIIIPILVFRVLKKLRLTSSIMMESVSERKIPYLIAVLLNLYITQYTLNNSQDVELYYFFAGISFTAIAFLILSYLNFKASLHSAAIGGVTMFCTAVSIHYQLNMILLIGLLLFCNGVVASSRLHLKAHTNLELIIGGLMGVSPQFMMMIYWV